MIFIGGQAEILRVIYRYVNWKFESYPSVERQLNKRTNHEQSAMRHAISPGRGKLLNRASFCDDWSGLYLMRNGSMGRLKVDHTGDMKWYVYIGMYLCIAISKETGYHLVPINRTRAWSRWWTRSTSSSIPFHFIQPRYIIWMCKNNASPRPANIVNYGEQISTSLHSLIEHRNFL